MYADDYDDWLPRPFLSGYQGLTNCYWMTLLQKEGYVGSAEFGVCPDSTNDLPVSVQTSLKTAYVNTYGMPEYNRQGWDTTPSGWCKLSSIRGVRITDQAQQILLADSGTYSSYWKDFMPLGRIRVGFRYFNTDGSLSGVSMPSNNGDQNSDALMMRHGNIANAAFFDGHAEAATSSVLVESGFTKVRTADYIARQL
jgi:prepilin-type processing-associated H-X9-DG protein